jgi:hypothetical protein
MNTWEFMERGSVLLVTLLAIVFDDRFLTKLKSVAEDQKNLTGAGREQRFDPESPTPGFYEEKLLLEVDNMDTTIQCSSLHKVHITFFMTSSVQDMFSPHFLFLPTSFITKVSALPMARSQTTP